MDLNAFQSMAESIHLNYSENEPLSHHTSFRIGGPAEIYAEPENTEQISVLVRFAKEHNIRLLPLGKGSNVLVPDEGLKDIVLHFGQSFSNIELFDDETIYCQAGTSLTKLCHFALEHSLTGLEFAYGIPGSVGGAVFMNAGAYGGEMKDILLYADHFDENGAAGRFSGEELELSYRHSVYSEKDYFITGAAFHLHKGDQLEIKTRMEELLSKRYEKQPMDKPSAGSTFKRPEGAFASALIDQCGLKGLRVGGASVSTKHAGFVINDEQATCRDVLELMDLIRKKVQKETGYCLESEIKILRN